MYRYLSVTATKNVTNNEQRKNRIRFEYDYKTKLVDTAFLLPTLLTVKPTLTIHEQY